MERSKPSIASRWGEEGGPSAAMQQSLTEIWFGNQYSRVVPDPIRSALPVLELCPGQNSGSAREILNWHQTYLNLVSLPLPVFTPVLPAWPAPLTSALLLDSPLYLQSYLLLQTIVGFQQQPRAAGHFIKRWPHSAPSLNSRGLGPKWLGKSAGLEL